MLPKECLCITCSYSYASWGVRFYGPYGTDPPYPRYVIHDFFFLCSRSSTSTVHRVMPSPFSIRHRNHPAVSDSLSVASRTKYCLSATVQSPRSNISRTTSLPKKKHSVPLPISTRQGQCKGCAQVSYEEQHRPVILYRCCQSAEAPSVRRGEQIGGRTFAWT